MNNLTVKRVLKLLRQGQPGRHRDGEVRGLYLDVGGKRNAHWALRYQLNHRPHWMGLGSARDFNLTEARERARKERQRLYDGDDPLLLRRADRAAKAATQAVTKTFREAAEGYLRDHQGKWKNAQHGKQWLSTLQTYVYPKLGPIDVRAIGRPHVLDVLRQRVEARQDSPAGEFWRTRAVTADRVRNRIELILTWAEAQGYRSGENPARSDLIKNVLPAPNGKAVEHHAAVPYEEVPAVVAALREHKGVAAAALEFLILTATRANEVRGAIWDEVDLDNALWVIPSHRMKNGKEHKVPLSDRAVEILRGALREAGNPHVFIGGQQPALSTAALIRLMKRLRPEATVHGLRSSFSDWSHERTNHTDHCIEMCLAHTVGGQVERSYRRGEMMDKRRRLMADWARYCTTPTKQVRRSATLVGINEVRS
jgi:integrase